MRKIRIGRFVFSMTSSACPEQYDVFLDGKQVAYLRLRWGMLSLSVPDVSGDCRILRSYDDDLKGEFDDERERMETLKMVAEILDGEVEKNGRGK